MRSTYRRRRQVLFPLWSGGTSVRSGKSVAARTGPADFASAARVERTHPTYSDERAAAGRTRDVHPKHAPARA